MVIPRFYVAALLCVTLLCVALPACFTSNAHAGVINGDFSHATPLFGFTPSGTDVLEPTGEFAQLATDGSFVRTLELALAIPSVPSNLSFDFAFSTTSTSATPPTKPDSFEVSLITLDNQFLDLLVVDVVGVKSVFGVSPDFSISIPGFAGLGGTEVSGRVSLALPSSVLGKSATIYFDLLNNDSTFGSIAAVDNITLTSTNHPVPEPASLAVWGVFLCIGRLIGRSRRR
jgi:hypothetical protein